jgi:hypothetical protein
MNPYKPLLLHPAEFIIKTIKYAFLFWPDMIWKDIYLQHVEMEKA